MKTLNQIAEQIRGAKSALLFCHIHPDGDTIGSAVALSLALKKLNIACDVVCDGEIPQKYFFSDIFTGIFKPEEVQKKYDVHIAIDVATEYLLGATWSIYNSCENRICVDHHLSNEHYAPYTFVRESASASIIVADLIRILGVQFDDKIATAVLLGIITDTGNFAHDNTNQEALITAGEMVGFGASTKQIVRYIYKNQSKNRVKLYIDVMKGMRFYLQDRLAIIITLKADLEKYSLGTDVTEGWVDDLPMSVSGVEVAVSILQTKNNLYKISFRSKGRADVNLIASEFGGGGHRLASGCVISGYLEEVIEKVVRAVDINI